MMMLNEPTQLTVYPGKPLRGTVELPGDKSISHRAALFAALAEGESIIQNFLISGVTQAMLSALTALDVSWQLTGTTLTVQGNGLKGIKPPAKPLNCGNSATTMRLLTGALAAAGIPAVLTGSPGLRTRPMRRIIDPLQKMGVPIQASEEGTAPLILQARPSDRPLQALDYTLPVASAQVKTCLLLAGLAAESTTRLVEPAPSRDHTERMLVSMGVSLNSRVISKDNTTQYETNLLPTQPLSLAPLVVTIPGDISAAAFLVVAGLITQGSEVRLPDVGLNPTRTGLLDLLRSMGGEIQIKNQHEQHGEPVGDLIVRYSCLRGTHVSGPLVVRMIDEFPIFSVAAACSQGETTVRQAQELRHKESDRITALCQGLEAFGVVVQEKPDGFMIQGGEIAGGRMVNPHGDHRLAMALAVAGLASKRPVIVQEAGIMAESFPEFTSALGSLGAKIKLERAA